MSQNFASSSTFSTTCNGADSQGLTITSSPVAIGRILGVNFRVKKSSQERKP
nr:hypothetical protein [Photobacterium phosphoreum]